MAIKEAGICLTLQGESAYLAGLKRISSEMKSMSLQGKLALAKLGGNAKQSEIFKTTAKNLSDQLTVSEKKTKSLQDAQDNYQKSLLPLKNAISETIAKHQEVIQKFESLKQRYEELAQTEGKRSKATREAKDIYESCFCTLNNFLSKKLKLLVISCLNEQSLNI